MTQLELDIVGDSAANARLEVSVRPLRVIFFPGILMPDLYLDIYLTCPSIPVRRRVTSGTLRTNLWRSVVSSRT